MIHGISDELAFKGASSFVAEDVCGHQIEVMTKGEERLSRLLSLLAEARSSIDLIMYIFANDEAGEQIRDALTQASQRGVRVRMIVDQFGSSGLDEGFCQPLRAAGGEICFFSRKWRSSYLIRNHQKLILIDQSHVITGGFNIENDYLKDDGSERWLDLGFIISGPSVQSVVKWCDKLYLYARDHDGQILNLRRLIRHWPVGKTRFSWLVGGPTERLSPWAHALKKDMRHARNMDMAMAYFSPGQGVLRRMAHICKSGTARFIFSGKSDNPATIGASRLLYGFLMKRGAKIREYDRQPFHMKLIIIDDITYIGTANFDVRSLFINVEMMVRIVDQSFAAQMRSLFDHVADRSTIITPELHRQRAGMINRLRWLFSYLIVGVMDYTVSRRLNFGLGKNRRRS